jgi:hypothetical protein
LNLNILIQITNIRKLLAGAINSFSFLFFDTINPRPIHPGTGQPGDPNPATANPATPNSAMPNPAMGHESRLYNCG